MKKQLPRILIISDLSDASFRLLELILEFSEEGVNQENLKELLQFSTYKIKKSLSELLDKGYLKNPGDFGRYELCELSEKAEEVKQRLKEKTKNHWKKIEDLV